VTAVPGTSLFFTGSKDGDVKLWDVSKATMLGQWHKVHDRHTFLQHNARGFGAFVQQAAVTDVQPVTNGFLTCGGDGIVKLFKHQY
jgi:WD40 repeat protein